MGNQGKHISEVKYSSLSSCLFYYFSFYSALVFQSLTETIFPLTLLCCTLLCVTEQEGNGGKYIPEVKCSSLSSCLFLLLFFLFSLRLPVPHGNHFPFDFALLHPPLWD
ncbi:hypothetical protein XELAEV_18021839mg [Xenopus laevis]|uniref:Uncharacterized protein n=1 Tax=Xenopus laevis TaxID=8355 RepID=A0A974D3K5_XENLA|nr:hypothetical protein XELAEV_18021839mg [Xenopus laevis]